MIIYGSRSTHLKSARLPNAQCPSCGTKGQLTASIYGRHAHVFWIPLFAAGRTGVFECQNCHRGFKKRELGQDGRLAYKNFNGTVKTPLWKFSGLAIIALLVAYGAFVAKQDKNRLSNYLANPAMFDVYTLRTDNNYYTTFKVIEVFKDSIYVNYNKMETNKITGIREINKAENYIDSVYYVINNKQLQALHSAGDIKDIDR